MPSRGGPASRIEVKNVYPDRLSRSLAQQALEIGLVGEPPLSAEPETCPESLPPA
jgi:hypothetical protein